MGITEFLLLAGAAVVGVLATAVYGMLALPHGYYRAARGCAWAAATVFVALAVLWGFETDAMFLTRAAIVGIVGAIASIALVEALRQIKHIEQHELEKPPLAAKARNPGLFVDCNIVMLPIKAPPDGRLFSLNLVPTPIENGGGGMNVHAIAGGSDYKFSDGLRHVYRCQVINYESVTVTDISMDLHLTFQEVIQVGDNPNNQRSGEVTLARSWPITIAKIDPGPQNPFVFYIFSATRHFVYVRFPAGATARRIGENTPMMLPVNSTSTAPMSFGPQNL